MLGSPSRRSVRQSHQSSAAGGQFQFHPSRACGRIGLDRYRSLAGCIRAVLAAAIDQGGTSLRDFVQEDGSPGYFSQSLKVYGRAGEPCPTCAAPIRRQRIGQRSSFYCPHCQH